MLTHLQKTQILQSEILSRNGSYADEMKAKSLISQSLFNLKFYSI